MRGKHWEEIRAALGDEKPMSTTYIDEPGETWFAVMNAGIYVWSNGTLHKEAFQPPPLLCTERRVFYQPRKSLYVELAVYGDVGVLTCAVDNGFNRQFPFDPTELAERCAHYESVGFARVGPWHLSQNQVVVREYRSKSDKAVLRVDGKTFLEGYEEVECSDRAAAEALAEERVAKLLQTGFQFVLVETMGARHQNPAPVTPPNVPKMATWPEPSTANEAVDQAMARLEELHRLFPAVTAVLELIKLPEEAARAASFVGGEFPKELCRAEIGEAPEPVKNSFEYFQARYQSITWAVLGTWNSADDYVDTFQSNFGHGAKCLMEIRDVSPFSEEWANDFDMPELTCLSPLDSDTVFDTRFTSEEGEHPVVRFDYQAFPKLRKGPPKTIQPFGFWLLERVTRLSKKVRPWLIKTQG